MIRPWQKFVGALALSFSGLGQGMFMSAQTPATPKASQQTVTAPNSITAPTNDKEWLEGFRKELSAAPCTIIGDTNHAEPLIRIMSSDSMLDVLQLTGKKYLGIEEDVTSQGAIDQLANGKISIEQFVKLRKAQMSARGEITFHGDTETSLRDEGELISKAAQRGIQVISFDRMEGASGPLHAFSKEVHKDYKSYRKDGGTKSIETFADENEDKAYDTMLNALVRNRIAPGLNAHMLSSMTHTMKTDGKQFPNSHGFEIKDHELSGLVIFVGSNHAPPLVEAAKRKGIESRAVLLFNSVQAVGAYDSMQNAISRDLHIDLPDSHAANYVVWGNQWHGVSAKEPASIPATKPKSFIMR